MGLGFDPVQKKKKFFFSISFLYIYSLLPLRVVVFTRQPNECILVSFYYYCCCYYYYDTIFFFFFFLFISFEAGLLGNTLSSCKRFRGRYFFSPIQCAICSIYLLQEMHVFRAFLCCRIENVFLTGMHLRNISKESCGVPFKKLSYFL